MLLNNQKVTEEIRGNLKIHRKNDNENMMTQNLEDVAKVVLRGKLVAMQSYSRNKQNLK